MKDSPKTNPPGRKKIMAAFSRLILEKDFHSITTAEIARTAQVTEGLIYKYFKDKKDLLHQVLDELFLEFQATIENRIADEHSCVGKLETIIFSSLEGYAANRSLSRILLLEVRNAQEYFSSRAYDRVRRYTRTLRTIIEQGMQTGELKSDTDPGILLKVVLGAIEHACLAEVIFGRTLDIREVSDKIATIVLNGVRA